MSLSLYSTQALLILDNSGNRLYAKYTTPPHLDQENDLSTLKQQQTFEKDLFKKTNGINAEVLLFESHLVLYKQIADVLIYIVAPPEENEVVLSTTLDGFKDALDKLLDYAIDKKAVLENYDLVAIAADEVLDDGVVLETQGAIIAARTSRAPTGEVVLSGGSGDLEKGLLSAWSFAKGKLAERLQGL